LDVTDVIEVAEFIFEKQISFSAQEMTVCRGERDAALGLNQFLSNSCSKMSFSLWKNSFCGCISFGGLPYGAARPFMDNVWELLLAQEENRLNRFIAWRRNRT
jgi:hypothetical protein